MQFPDVAKIMVPEDLIDGVLVKVRNEQEEGVKLFGLKDGKIFYLDKDPEGCCPYDIPLAVLKNSELPEHKVIWDEIQKYKFYKMVVHGRLK